MAFIGNQSYGVVKATVGDMKGTVQDEASLQDITNPVDGDVYVASDSGKGFVYDGSTWVDLGELRGPIGPQGLQGIEGPVGPSGTGIVINGVDTEENIKARSDDTAGTVYIASDTGDGWVYSGSAWTNLGAIKADGINSIEKTDTTDNTDTYTMWLDADKTISLGTFDVANGIDGANGADGIDGIGITSIDAPSTTGEAGTTDTYTITLSDNSTSTFDVYNGADMTDVDVLDDDNSATSTTYSSNKIDLGLAAVQSGANTKSVAMAIALS